MRPNIAQALNLMKSYLKEAKSSVDARDAESGKSYMDLLEEQVKYLEGLSGK